VKTKSETILGKIYIHARPNLFFDADFEGVESDYYKENSEINYRICTSESGIYDNEVLVKSSDVSVDIPGGFDLTPGIIEKIEKEKERVSDDYYQKIKNLDEKLQELRAIEHNG